MKVIIFTWQRCCINQTSPLWYILLTKLLQLPSCHVTKFLFIHHSHNMHECFYFYQHILIVIFDGMPKLITGANNSDPVNNKNNSSKNLSRFFPWPKVVQICLANSFLLNHFQQPHVFPPFYSFFFFFLLMYTHVYIIALMEFFMSAQTIHIYTKEIINENVLR